MNLPWLCILNLCDLIMWPARSTFQAFKLTFKLYTRLSLVSLCPRRRRPFAPFLCLYIYRRSPRQWLASATSRCSAAAGQMLPWRRRVPGIVHQQVHRVHLNRLPCCMPGADSPPGTAACFVSKGWEVGRLLYPFLTGLRLAESGPHGRAPRRGAGPVRCLWTPGSTGGKRQRHWQCMSKTNLPGPGRAGTAPPRWIFVANTGAVASSIAITWIMTVLALCFFECQIFCLEGATSQAAVGLCLGLYFCFFFSAL